MAGPCGGRAGASAYEVRREGSWIIDSTNRTSPIPACRRAAVASGPPHPPAHSPPLLALLPPFRTLRAGARRPLTPCAALLAASRRCACAAAPSAASSLRSSAGAAAAAARRCRRSAADHPARARAARPARPRRDRRGRRRVPARRRRDPRRPADATTRPRTSRAPSATCVISRDGNVFSGPELQLKVQRFEGFFRSPTYRFGAHRRRRQGRRASTSSTTSARSRRRDLLELRLDGTGAPAWMLSAGELRDRHEANEGIARDAVLRFYGVPILAAPAISFPLNDAAQVGLAAAEPRARQPQRLPGGDPVLLEHRAEPRRDVHARR